MKMTTTLPYTPGPATLIGGPFCGIGCPRGLEKSWTIQVTEDPGIYSIYERKTPNDSRYYFKGIRVMRTNQ